MIHAALSHLANQLNQFLKRNLELMEDMVILSSLVDQDGSAGQNTHNKLALFLVNVEQESFVPFNRNSNTSFTNTTTSTPPLSLSLYVMVAANFSSANYAEALKFLSNTVAFFQRQPHFTHQNTPDLDRRINQLSVSMENLSIQDLSSLWGNLGGKYHPSALYKVRMVTFDAGDVLSQVSPIASPVSGVR